METRTEIMQNAFEDRRADFLRDQEIETLMDLLDEDAIKEILIGIIIDNNLDKQINEDVI